MPTLLPGNVAPLFSLPASTGKTVSLNELAGKKVILYFYPKDDTPGCTKEACGFRDLISEIKMAGAEVFGVSPDSVESHQAFIKKFALTFPLLADTEKTVANAYGAWGEKIVRGKKRMGVIRMTFLIDKNGSIERIWPKVQPEDHPDEVLRAIKD
jgi:peroxiredoxin Q/BCP